MRSSSSAQMQKGSVAAGSPMGAKIPDTKSVITAAKAAAEMATTNVIFDGQNHMPKMHPKVRDEL